MKELLIAVISFLAGVVICRLYYAKAIKFGRALYSAGYREYEQVLAFIRSKV